MRMSLNPALTGILKASLDSLTAFEELSAETIHTGLEAGSMVLLANPNHPDVTPTLIGKPSRIKVNANLGTSPFSCAPEVEIEKLRAAEHAGAHAVMDLSTAGDLDAMRVRMLDATSLPLGTVPIYALAQKKLAAKEDPASFTDDEMLAEIVRQAEQGVDFMTLHCGLTRRGAEAADARRVLGIVSRGGSIIARRMAKQGTENPFFARFDDILAICKEHNVTLSLGDGLRPGAGVDAGDFSQWDEVLVLGELVGRAREAGVQAMVEGPGHVPLHEVESQMQVMKRLCREAPLYVLGPLVTDCAPGYDHIAGAIGGALAARSGADFLCYLTPAEHLTLPSLEDVRAGVMASRVAAQAAEVAMGRPGARERDLAISKARKALDWQAMRELALDPDMVSERRKDHADREECAMCGEFCAVKMLR